MLEASMSSVPAPLPLLGTIGAPSVLNKVTRISFFGKSLYITCPFFFWPLCPPLVLLLHLSDYLMRIPITAITTPSYFGTWNTQDPELGLCNLLTPRSPAFLQSHVPNKITQTTILHHNRDLSFPKKIIEIIILHHDQSSSRWKGQKAPAKLAKRKQGFYWLM